MATWLRSIIIPSFFFPSSEFVWYDLFILKFESPNIFDIVDPLSVYKGRDGIWYVTMSNNY